MGVAEWFRMRILVIFAGEMREERDYMDKDVKGARRGRAYGYVLVCVVVVFVIGWLWMKNRESERRLREAEYRYEWVQDSIKRAREAERQRIVWEQEIKEARRIDSAIAARRRVEELTKPEPEQPKYTWDRLESMVRDLSNEGYYAVVWKVNDGSSAWIVKYKKGGREYIRRFNPETGKYGPVTRLKQHDVGEFSVYGDKSRWYRYGPQNVLIYEVNGEERERFGNFRLIDLYTPGDGDEDEEGEDFYYDNEEDMYMYYGR